MGSASTAVLDARRTLAEYEKKMLGKEAAENSDEPDPTSWGHFFDIPEEQAGSSKDSPTKSTDSSKDGDDADHMIEMAEFSAIEGIPLDEEMLRELYGVTGDDDDKKENDDKEDDDKELDR